MCISAGELSLNANKTEFLVFRPKSKTNKMVILRLNNINLKESTKVKYSDHYLVIGKVKQLKKSLKNGSRESQMQELLKEGQNINYPKNIDELSLHQDEKILELSLSNLVHNAIKFNCDGGSVTISCWPSGSKIIFKVKDSGRGVSLEKLSTIWKAFAQTADDANVPRC